MAEAMKELSFEELIQQNTWCVPEIQREYVWGSKDSLLGHFFQDIAQQSFGYNIGFLYSYTPHIAEEKSGLVHLIDGQQRFTTLYLAAFYFSLLEGKPFCYAEKFSYRVRSSTAEFLSLLMEKVENPQQLQNLKEQTWFLSCYSKDPSIESMCALFQWLGKNYADKPMLDKIMKVEFWNFNLDEAGQGEELYIKMNSRGETLSDNENIRPYLLEKADSQSKHALGKEFDNWQEFFWKYRGENPTADPGLNAFLVLVAIIELHKNKPENLTYSEKGIQDIADKLYASAQETGLTFDKIRPYFEVLKKLAETFEGGSSDEIAPKLLKASPNPRVKNYFENYLTGNVQMRGLMFLLPLLAFYAGHPRAKIEARWVRFFYNIAFNQGSQALKEILALACEARTKEWTDPLSLLDYPALGAEEKSKLEQLKAHPAQRAELEQIFQDLEDHPITKGTIAPFIGHSSVNGQLDWDRLKKYKAILNDCYPASIDSRDLLRGALLAAGSYQNPDQAFGLYDGYTYGGIYQSRYHFCKGDQEWAKSFQEKTSCYFVLFNRLLAGETQETIIKHFEDKGNAFYRIIKNPNILRFSVQKRYTFDWGHNEAGHILSGIRVMKNNKDYCCPVPFFDIEDMLSKKGIPSEYEDNGLYFSIGGTQFELWYNYEDYLKFSLWVKKENFLTKLQGFKLEKDWYYVDNLKTEEEVLKWVEDIKGALA